MFVAEPGADGAELRLDITTGDWVVLAKRRAQRPHDYTPGQPSPLADASGCPFCPGRELQTGAERWRWPDAADWRVRVVDNLFPVVAPVDVPALVVNTMNAIAQEVVSQAEALRTAPGHGMHEVVVETPAHDVPFHHFDDAHVVAVFRAYRSRLRALAERDGVASLLVFKNHGPRSGASLMHAHSQIVALPFVPPVHARTLAAAERHVGEHGVDPLRAAIDAEREVQARVIHEDAAITVLNPFAARVPYETWIVPRANACHFAMADDATLAATAVATRRALAALHTAVGEHSYNFVLHTAPVGIDSTTPWSVRIMPRFAAFGGIELGAGFFINGKPPEDCTRELRPHY